MEQNPTVIAEADDNPNKDINVAFFKIPFTKRYSFSFHHHLFLLLLLALINLDLLLQTN